MIAAPAPLFGPYRPPRWRVGGTLLCAMRGRVTVYGLSDAPVPWPYTRGRMRGRPSPILCGDLARAVRREANVVVCALFGVTGQTVTKWRRALGVGHANPGTSRRKSESRKGRPRPPHVRAVLDRTGRPTTAAHRAKLSAAARRNCTRPPKAGRPWTAREDGLLWWMRPAAVAARTRRTLAAVYVRRSLLRLGRSRPWGG